MTHERQAVASSYLWLRVAATIAAWVLIISLVHRLAHIYQPEIVEILKHPVLQVLATAALLTALIWLVSLSLPLVSNPGPRTIGMVFLWLMLLVGGHSLAHMEFVDAQAMLSSMREAVGPLTIGLLALVYAIALGVPFVPGMELGLLIMAVFGPLGALVAYVATIGGLSAAYAIGRMLPEPVIARMLERFAISVPREGASFAMDDMLAGSRLGRTAPAGLAAFLRNYRYLTLALCLNLPGNSIVGGGGGLALLCGLSRQFRWRAFVLTVAVATSPVPMLVALGWLDLEPLMEHYGVAHDALTWIGGLFIHE